jgi:hypothetical protein
MKVIFEKISKFLIDKTLKIFIDRYKIGKDQLSIESEVIYPDGIISVNQDAYSITMKDEYGVFISNIVDCDNAINLINKYKILDQELLVGREENYIIFRKDFSLQIKNNTTTFECANTFKVVSPEINFNGIKLTILNGKLLLNGKEISVVGATIDPATNKIINSGQ